MTIPDVWVPNEEKIRKAKAESKVYKKKTFEVLPKFLFAEYQGCTFYLNYEEMKIVDLGLWHCEFDNCSFRTDTYFYTRDDVHFNNCNFSGRLHIKKDRMPYGVNDKVTHLEYASMRGRLKFPEGIFELTNLEILDISETSIMEIPLDFIKMENLKKIKAVIGCEIKHNFHKPPNIPFLIYENKNGYRVIRVIKYKYENQSKAFVIELQEPVPC